MEARYVARRAFWRPLSAHEVEMDSRRDPETDSRPVHEHTANPELLDALRRLRRKEREWE